MVPVLWTGGPGMHTTAQYSWFIGMGLGFVVYAALASALKVPHLSRVGAPADVELAETH
jgi:NCS1 family nucleobase:cation symporter-1